MTHDVTVLSVTSRDSADPTSRSVQAHSLQVLDVDTGPIRTSNVFTIHPGLSGAVIANLLESGLGDTILYDIHEGEPKCPPGAARYIAVDLLPGVTDDRASTLATVLADLDGLASRQHSVHVRDVYWLESSLAETELRSVGERVIANPLISDVTVGGGSEYCGFHGKSLVEHSPSVTEIDVDLADEKLMALSTDRLLALSLDEMKAIRDQYRDPVVRQQRSEQGLSECMTDVELEILAQTWSEHCKHKEFRAVIDYLDSATGERLEIRSLFATFIEKATQYVANSLSGWGHTWLLKVFNDNAGVVRFDKDQVFVWKVETHNSPSALDPYGGAITGILGNNRDPFGTGIGGGRLLFNTNVLCFGRPDYAKPLLSGQLHPRRVLQGVRKGIEDGGNQCGIPTVNGAIVFDDRYAGKPLVFCGTGSLAPSETKGLPWWEKKIVPHDRIMMVGGRVGKDGIHGATFSSIQLDESMPRSVVQIGSPITQKMLFDFLDDACRRGLVRCCTDNGAGGLSSSVGELADLAGGADINLDRVPLKYPGLDPWEIFVSESQERMTLAIDPQNVAATLELAEFYEVEATDIGEFTDSGNLVVRHASCVVAFLPLDFLHHGVPRKHLQAEWISPKTRKPKLPDSIDHGRILGRLLSDLNICSREPVIRQYDHEVQAGAVIKPLMGPEADGPQDAAVMWPDVGSMRGIAVSNGIAPQYGDLDPYHAAAGAFDEAVRQIIAVGGRLPGPENSLFWSVNDNFCVPNSAYDPETNPDGKQKLGALVRMCRATYDMATAYTIPLTSGKDSMKNDFHSDGQTISVPPTVLFSAAAGIRDVGNSITTDFKAPGDRIYLLGRTYNELGASAFYRLFAELGAHVPKVRPAQARRLYELVALANEEGLVSSCHDLAEGGLAVAIAESALGGRLGCRISVDGIVGEIDRVAALYSESHSRFVASVAQDSAERFEQLLGDFSIALGEVTQERRLVIVADRDVLIDAPLDSLSHAWKSPLQEML